MGNSWASPIVARADGRDLVVACGAPWVIAYDPAGGAELWVDGTLALAQPSREYAAIYEHFALLLRTGRSHVDMAPLELVADCLMRGRRVDVEPFA